MPNAVQTFGDAIAAAEQVTILSFHDLADAQDLLTTQATATTAEAQMVEFSSLHLRAADRIKSAALRVTALKSAPETAKLLGSLSECYLSLADTYAQVVDLDKKMGDHVIDVNSARSEVLRLTAAAGAEWEKVPFLGLATADLLKDHDRPNILRISATARTALLQTIDMLFPDAQREPQAADPSGLLAAYAVRVVLTTQSLKSADE
jgi:hypothetical protein